VRWFIRECLVCCFICINIVTWETHVQSLAPKYWILIWEKTGSLEQLNSIGNILDKWHLKELNPVWFICVCLSTKIDNNVWCNQLFLSHILEYHENLWHPSIRSCFEGVIWEKTGSLEQMNSIENILRKWHLKRVKSSLPTENSCLDHAAKMILKIIGELGEMRFILESRFDYYCHVVLVVINLRIG
jgi:hypothetical protein